MQDRHQNRRQYFEEQSITTEKFVIPYIEDIMAIGDGVRVLEIGCGEGGNLIPFVKRNCEIVANDIQTRQVENAESFIKGMHPTVKAQFVSRDIYKVNVEEIGRFDLIMMRDVIEHIHDQDKFLGFIHRFLKEKGIIFFGFPPWRMPFGGHQQICKSRFLSKTPWIHLLPAVLYKWLLKMFGESPKTVESLLEIKETGISISRFERLVKKHKYKVLKKTQYFINPNYETKFGLQPRELNFFFASLPYFKDFFTTCCYYIIKKQN